LAKFKGIRI